MILKEERGKIFMTGSKKEKNAMSKYYKPFLSINGSVNEQHWSFQ